MLANIAMGGCSTPSWVWLDKQGVVFKRTAGLKKDFLDLESKNHLKTYFP